jgi:TonB family protein
MKAVNKLAVLISLGALLPFAASAKTLEQTYLDAALKAPGVPVPVAVVSPSDVDAKYSGAKVELAFTVDAMGIPTNFSVVSSPDATLAKVMMDAVSKWRFTPVQKNGIAIATRVVLPVRVSGTDSRYAAN